jgi:hypothetical protein
MRYNFAMRRLGRWVLNGVAVLSLLPIVIYSHAIMDERRSQRALAAWYARQKLPLPPSIQIVYHQFYVKVVASLSLFFVFPVAWFLGR